jgi:HPt (histidine-containing phosphotransfer) domain-containing protein
MIDWERVDSLRDEIGMDDFAEVAGMFLEEADEVVARMRTSAAPGPKLAADLHFLKGSALNLGFSELAGLCSAGEKLADAGQPVNVDQVIQTYAASRTSFEARLGARSSAA